MLNKKIILYLFLLFIIIKLLIKKYNKENFVNIDYSIRSEYLNRQSIQDKLKIKKNEHNKPIPLYEKDSDGKLIPLCEKKKVKIETTLYDINDDYLNDDIKKYNYVPECNEYYFDDNNEKIPLTNDYVSDKNKIVRIKGDLNNDTNIVYKCKYFTYKDDNVVYKLIETNDDENEVQIDKDGNKIIKCVEKRDENGEIEYKKKLSSEGNIIFDTEIVSNEKENIFKQNINKFKRVNNNVCPNKGRKFLKLINDNYCCGSVKYTTNIIKKYNPNICDSCVGECANWEGDMNNGEYKLAKEACFAACNLPTFKWDDNYKNKQFIDKVEGYKSWTLEDIKKLYSNEFNNKIRDEETDEDFIDRLNNENIKAKQIMRTIGCHRLYGDEDNFYYWDNSSESCRIGKLNN